MYYNLKDIEEIVNAMKCRFADLVWKQYLRDQYALQTKDCIKTQTEDITNLLPIIEAKQKLLSNYKKNAYYYSHPSYLENTDVDMFWNSDCYLKDCTDTVLNRYRYLAIKPSILNLSGNQCSTC